MNSQEYIEVSIKITPFSEENADIVTAEISELPYESFSAEDPFLKCYIQKDLYDAQALKVLLGGLEGYGFDIDYSANLMPAVNWNLPAHLPDTRQLSRATRARSSDS